MPPAATLPRASHTRRTVRHVPLEERVAVLETHSPMLATKADVKAEVRGTENRLIMWIFGAALALLAAILPMISANTARIDALAARTDARIDKLEDKVEARFDKLDARIDKLDAKFDALLAELRAQRERRQ